MLGDELPGYDAWKTSVPEAEERQRRENPPEPISEFQYVAKGGLRCPICGCDDIEGGPWDSSPGEAWQEITCRECESMWVDLYKLTGYERVD